MNIFKKDVSDWNFKNKLAFTILMLVVYRIGVMIPIPFVNSNVFKDAVDQSQIAGGLLSAAAMVGGSLTQLGVFSLGVMPYITASIIFQLLKVAVPKLQALGQTDSGKKQITQWTRYVTVFLGFTQALGVVLGAPALMGINIFTEDTVIAKIIAVLTMTAGTLIIMRMGEELTAKGIGNGMSVIIFTSILSSLPNLIYQSYLAKGILSAIALFIILALILAMVSYIEKCEYRLSIVYAKTSTRKTVNHNNLPIKLAIAGVLPVILSSVLISVPRLLEGVWDAGWIKWWNIHIGQGTIAYGIVFSLLTIAMTFFSVVIVFNVQEISKNIKTNGGFVTGKRPGEDTEVYLKYIANEMAGLDAIYLVLIGLVPLYLFPLVGVSEVAFGATSIIILCTVIVTILAVIDTERKTATLQESSFLNKSKNKENSKNHKNKKMDKVSKKTKKDDLEPKGFLKR